MTAELPLHTFLLAIADGGFKAMPSTAIQRKVYEWHIRGPGARADCAWRPRFVLQASDGPRSAEVSCLLTDAINAGLLKRHKLEGREIEYDITPSGWAVLNLMGVQTTMP